MDESLYDQFAGMDRDHWWFQGRRRIVAGVLRDRLGPADERRAILDVGCGTGEMLDMLTEFGQVKGIDMSARAVEHCRNRFSGTVDTIDVVVGRIPDDVQGPYGLVTAFDVIEHLDDDVAALEHIKAALQPEGLFVCTVPAFPFLWSSHDEINHHRRRYTRRTLLRSLRAAGFSVEKISHFNSFLFPVVAAVRLAHKAVGSTGGGSDVTMPARAVNRMLSRIFAAERSLVRRTSLPFGVSLLAVCRNPSAARA